MSTKSIEDAVGSLLLPEVTEEETETEVAEEVETEEVETESDDSDEYEDEDEYTDDDESDVEDEQADDEEHETYTVKVDGAEVQVTLDELTRSYSGQGKIQKGMQEAAEMRKQAEQVYQALLDDRQQMAQMLQGMQQTGVLQEPKPPSQEMFSNDPIGYMEARMQYDAQVEAYRQQQGQLQQFNQEQQARMQQAQQVYLQQEAAKIREKIPELADPAKAGKLQKEFMDYASSIGYSADDIRGITDHRALLVLRDAAKFHALQNGKEKVMEKTKTARKKVTKPGAKRTVDPVKQQTKQQRSKLKRSGKVEDALSLILQTE